VSGGTSFGSNTVSQVAGLFGDLPATGIDLAFDAPRSRIYVSLPTLNEVAILDASTLAILNRVVVGIRPHGLSLSSDGQRLFSALNTAGAVAVLDLASMSVDTIQVGTDLDDARAWDVLEVQPNVLLVTSNPSSSGFAYVVRIALDFAGSHSATRVASNRIIRAAPELERSSNGGYAYVGEGFSPNSLYKLDMSNPAAPIVLEDQHGAVSGTDRFAVSPDNARIYLRSGQILQATTFSQVGTIGVGIPVPSPDGTRIHVAMSSPLALRAYDSTTLLPVGEVPLAENVDRMIRVESHGYLLALAGDRVYALPIP
jgi:DNA-binding beta-propeller fold protein YncE